MTDAEHYRREAEECRAYAEQAWRVGHRTKWRALTDEAREYDRLAAQAEAVEAE